MSSGNPGLRPIQEVAARAGITDRMLTLYSRDKAKVSLEALRAFDEPTARRGRLIAVTAMSPTPFGEGKTVTAIGLIDALNRLAKPTIGTLRQPSLGPIFGKKGGATGGGQAQLSPGQDINLHFTGDFHAVAAAQNLLAAMVDNHLFRGNRLGLDPEQVAANRTIDVDDRALRRIALDYGSATHRVARECAVDVVAATEVMAVLSLATDRADLKRRLSRIVVGLSRDGHLVTAADLRAHGAMAVLLKDAIAPNLVQTLEGSPVLVHAGPFANVASGNSSIIADRVALPRAEYVVTESGFGSECGFEKLVYLKCRTAGYQPDVGVLVVTSRALRWQGGGTTDRTPDSSNPEAVRVGCANMAKHIENLQAFGCRCVVAINVFDNDSEVELSVIEQEASKLGASVARSHVYAQGGAGGEELARAVLSTLEASSPARPLYPLDWDLRKKVDAVATRIYGAKAVQVSDVAGQRIDLYEAMGFGVLPICIAKTPSSLSHDPTLRNRPVDFVFPITDARLYAGAGYVLLLAGNITTMPGLPQVPAAESIDLDDEGVVRGV